MSAENPPASAPRRPPRKSGVVVPHGATWYQKLAAFLICTAIKLLALTIRYRMNDPHGFLQRKDFDRAVYCIWHNRLILCSRVYRYFTDRRHTPPRLVGLVSASKDGALLTRIFESLGIQAARGSSSRRGAQGLREMYSWAKRGYDLAVTPDGPRGPRYVAAEGTIMLAQLTGRPIVPVAYHVNWKIQLKSWDRFQIPLPFARCEIVTGRIMHVPRELSAEQKEKLRQELEAELRAITRD